MRCDGDEERTGQTRTGCACACERVKVKVHVRQRAARGPLGGTADGPSTDWQLGNESEGVKREGM